MRKVLNFQKKKMDRETQTDDRYPVVPFFSTISNDIVTKDEQKEKKYEKPIPWYNDPMYD